MLIFIKVALFCKTDVLKVELESTIDPSSTYQDLFNHLSFPINGLAAHGYWVTPSREWRHLPLIKIGLKDLQSSFKSRDVGH